LIIAGSWWRKIKKDKKSIQKSKPEKLKKKKKTGSKRRKKSHLGPPPNQESGGTKQKKRDDKAAGGERSKLTTPLQEFVKTKKEISFINLNPSLKRKGKEGGKTKKKNLENLSRTKKKQTILK